MFHRIFTIIINKELFIKNKRTEVNVILYSFFFTLNIIFFFGSNFLSNNLNLFFNVLIEYLQKINKKGNIFRLILSLFFILFLLLKSFTIIENKKKEENLKL